MKKLILLAPAIFFLSACGTPSVEDLIEDPQLFAKVSQECTTLMMQGKDSNTEKCNNAKKAAEQMAKNMMKGVQEMMPK